MGALYLFDGLDTFRQERAIEILINNQSVKSQEPLDATSCLEDVCLTLQSQSLFSGCFCYVIKDPDWFKHAWDASDEKKAERFLSILKQSSHDLVLSMSNKLDTRKKGVKWFLKHAKHQSFQPFKDWEDYKVTEWLLDYAKAHQIDLPLESCTVLVELLGTDLRNLVTQLHALEASQEKGKSITRETIRSFILNHHVSILDVSEALQSAKLKQTYQLCEQLLDQGEEPIRLLGFLAKQLCFYRLCLLDSNINDALIAKQAGKHPFVVKKTRQQLRAYNSCHQIDNMIDLLALTDTAIKKGDQHAKEGLQACLLKWL